MVKLVIFPIHYLLLYRVKHGFSCINIRQVPRKVLKTKAAGRGFQHLQRDPANVNARKTQFDPYSHNQS